MWRGSFSIAYGWVEYRRSGGREVVGRVGVRPALRGPYFVEPSHLV